MLGIINYGLGNIKSVTTAIEKIGSKYIILSEPKEFKKVKKLLLPGVGAFSKGMDNLKIKGLDDAIKKDVLINEKPILGICLGMQLLATESEEYGLHSGLNLIPGRVIKIDCKKFNYTIPHVGWNQIQQNNKSLLFKDIPNNTDFYFVHSYHYVNNKKEHVIGKSEYGVSINSVINKKNIYGIQPHPEKSQYYGLRLIKNFLKINY